MTQMSGPRRLDETRHGVFTLVLPAHLDRAGMDAILDECNWLEARMGVALKLMVDARALESMDAGARSALYRRSAEARPRKAAVLGKRGFQRILMTFLVLATRHPRTRFFLEGPAAWSWLVAEDLPAASENRKGPS